MPNRIIQKNGLMRSRIDHNYRLTSRRVTLRFLSNLGRAFFYLSLKAPSLISSRAYQFLNRYPEENIQETIPKSNMLKKPIAAKDNVTGTSDAPKNAHLNPEIRYSAGLNSVIVCHIGGNIFME